MGSERPRGPLAYHLNLPNRFQSTSVARRGHWTVDLGPSPHPPVVLHPLTGGFVLLARKTVSEHLPHSRPFI